MLLLLLSITLAKPPPAPPPLLISVVPTGKKGYTYHQLSWVPLPKGGSSALPWVSDYAPISCEANGDSVTIKMKLDPAAWPYTLPASATCTQSDVKIVITLGFREPSVDMWQAADGTIVVPYRDGQFRSSPFEAPEALASAAIEPPTAGVSCKVALPDRLIVGVEGNAKPGAYACLTVLVSGEKRVQQIVLVPY